MPAHSPLICDMILWCIGYAAMLVTIIITLWRMELHTCYTVPIIERGAVLALDVLAFERLLGPCLEVMRRNLASYDDDMNRAFGGKDKIADLR